LTIDGEHHVVKGWVRHAARCTANIGWRVRTRIPTLAGEIDAAAERDGVIDHDELLMVRATDRMRVVVTQVHAPAWPPARAHEARPLPIQAEDHGIVPAEDVHAQHAPLTYERVQQLADLTRP